MKRKKLRPFGKRLARSIMWTQFIVMGLASVLVFFEIKNTILMEEYDLYRSYLKISHQEISKVTSEVSLGMMNHVAEIEDRLGEPERLSAIMTDIVSRNPHIHSCGISFVSDYYPRKGHWYCPYTVRKEDGQIEEQFIGDADYDYLNAEWFTEALKADSGYWSKPFFDSTDSVTALVSYLIPIRDKRNKTVAVLGADMSLEWLSKRLISPRLWADSIDIHFDERASDDEIVVDDKGEVNTLIQNRKWRFITLDFVIDGDGTFLASPNKDRIVNQNYFKCAEATPDTIDDYVGRMMVAGKQGTYRDKDDDPCSFDYFEMSPFSVYLFFEPIEGTNWSVGLVVPAVMIDGMAILVGVVLLFFIGLALLIVRLVGWLLIGRATKPLKHLATSAKEVARGNFSAPLPEIKHNDEIHLLRDSFEDMQHSLTKYIEELKDTTASKAAIDNELRVAHDIQMGMLPKVFPPYPERDDIDIFGQLTPAKDVGGDLFDFYLRDNQLFFCVGDVSGKGVPASLVMAVTRSLFRNISAHTTAPNQIISTLNTSLIGGNETNMFVTCFVGVLDLSDGCLRYSNAGHNLPLLIGQGVGQLPCDPNVPLGVIDDWEFTVQEIDIAPKTTIFLYTDGLNEAENMQHAQFDIKRVLTLSEKLLAEGKNDPQTIINQMIEAVHEFVGGAEQSDDLTMLAIKYNSTNGREG